MVIPSFPRRLTVVAAVLVLAACTSTSTTTGTTTSGTSATTTTGSTGTTSATDTASASGTAGGTAGGTAETTGPTGTTCDASGCTVVLQRRDNARASVFGITVQVTGVTPDQVTLKVGDREVTVSRDAHRSTQIAGLSLTLQRIDAEQIVLRITRS